MQAGNILNIVLIQAHTYIRKHTNTHVNTLILTAGYRHINVD